MNDKNIEEKSKLIAERNKRLEIIKNIPVNRSNFEYIAESGSINGSLMLDIEKAMDKYQSDTITQYKEALRDIIPLAERAMDDIRTLVSERELITKVRQLLTDNMFIDAQNVS